MFKSESCSTPYIFIKANLSDFLNLKIFLHDALVAFLLEIVHFITCLYLLKNPVVTIPKQSMVSKSFSPVVLLFYMEVAERVAISGGPYKKKALG